MHHLESNQIAETRSLRAGRTCPTACFGEDQCAIVVDRNHAVSSSTSNMATVDKQQKAENAAKLQAEVQAFASQLGLAAAGGSHAGFDDSDFRPEAAKKKIGDSKPKQNAAKEQQQQGTKRSKQPAGQDQQQQPAKRQKQQQGVLGKHLAAQAKQQAAAAAKQEERKGRDWNVGVGPRPGTCLAA